MDLKRESIEGRCGELLKKYFLSEKRSGYMRLEGCFMPDHFPQVAQRVLDLEVRDDDIWVCTFPKTGTTWTQEMVWCIANNLNYEGAKTFLAFRFPFLEVGGLFLDRDASKTRPARYLSDPVQYVQNMESPRFIKSHLPYHLLPLQLQKGQTNAKIVTVSRNPKDVCVSYYYHCLSAEGYSGDFNTFTELFMLDCVPYAPFNDNVLSYWSRRDDANILHLKYEDMKKDLPSVIRKTAAFLGKDYNEEEVEGLAKHLSFSQMKNNPAVTNTQAKENEGLVRRGVVGGWREMMDEDTVNRFEHWTQERFRDTGLHWEDSIGA